MKKTGITAPAPYTQTPEQQQRDYVWTGPQGYTPRDLNSRRLIVHRSQVWTEPHSHIADPTQADYARARARANAAKATPMHQHRARRTT